MPIRTLHFHGNQVNFGIAVPLILFPELYRRHQSENPDTAAIEVEGRRLCAAEFPEAQVLGFVERVCLWGGKTGSRVFGRIEKNSAALRGALSKAARMLDNGQAGCRGAMEAIKQLKGLGKTPECLSYASKILRFIRPELCPVFDSVLQGRLPYGSDVTGYSEFSADCLALAEALEENGIENPRQDRRRGRWFAADVEAALYAYAIGW
jgi:hypothetical protein